MANNEIQMGAGTGANFNVIFGQTFSNLGLPQTKETECRVRRQSRCRNQSVSVCRWAHGGMTIGRHNMRLMAVEFEV